MLKKSLWSCIAIGDVCKKKTLTILKLRQLAAFFEIIFKMFYPQKGILLQKFSLNIVGF